MNILGVDGAGCRDVMFIAMWVRYECPFVRRQTQQAIPLGCSATRSKDVLTTPQGDIIDITEA